MLGTFVYVCFLAGRQASRQVRLLLPCSPCLRDSTLPPPHTRDSQGRHLYRTLFLALKVKGERRRRGGGRGGPRGGIQLRVITGQSSGTMPLEQCSLIVGHISIHRCKQKRKREKNHASHGTGTFVGEGHLASILHARPHLHVLKGTFVQPTSGKHLERFWQ